MRHARLIGGIALGISALGVASVFYAFKSGFWMPKNPQRVALAAAPTYIGSAACVACHAAEVNAWKGSHHERAMQHADDKTVLGNFANAQFLYNGVTTTFSRRDGRYWINTDGPDGTLTDYEVRYTFGVAPLQQYLVEFPGGRLQAFSVAWDARSQADGGQRWFHLYPHEKIDHKDELHWTKLSQNWNYMCSECHSTNVQKNYDPASNTFETKWSEIDVACEACHGPASRHVAWASKLPRDSREQSKGLTLLLHERAGVAWVREATAKTATRNQPRSTTVEIDTCARCHSRRSALTENYRPGRPLMDTHLPVLLTQPLYYADGQIRDEVFEYGSFLQSKMFEHGVTCSDCHEPHSLKLRAPGNQACLQCHSPDAYDTQKHHFHSPESKGAQCAGCHMPTTNFMVVHARHDHSIRIPRPDLSMKLHTPNACNNCHANRSAAWATDQMTRWYGKDWLSRWHFGETLSDAQLGKPIGQDLIAIAVAPQVADIARATATSLLPSHLEPTVAVALPRLLADKSPLVRRAALLTVELAPPAERWRMAEALLSDSVLAVRIEAARVLSVAPRESLTPKQQQLLDRGISEYVEAARASAEHPQSSVNLGLLYLGLGQFDKAEQAYLRAIKLEPTYAAAYINLADLYRQQQLDDRAESTLLAAHALLGDNAAVEHSLGLLYVRTRRMTLALPALAKAAQLEPDNARFGYVFAVALASNGESARAIRTLQDVLAKHPYDRDVLMGLVQYNKAAGNVTAASAYARRLLEVEPRYGTVEQIMQ